MRRWFVLALMMTLAVAMLSGCAEETTPTPTPDPIATQVAIEKAAAAGDRLTKGLEELFEKYNLPFVAFNFKSVLHIETGAPLALRLSDPDIFTQINVRKQVMDEFQAALLTEGIFTLAGSRGYTTLAHTNEIIDQALEAYDRVLQLVE